MTNYLDLKMNVLKFLGIEPKNSPLSTDVGEQHCPCPVLVSFFVSGVCLLSRFCQDFLSGVCLSGFCLSRFCNCPDSVRIIEKSCPFSVCPVEQGRDRAARTFTVLVRRRLFTNPLLNPNAHFRAI